MSAFFVPFSLAGCPVPPECGCNNARMSTGSLPRKLTTPNWTELHLQNGARHSRALFFCAGSTFVQAHDLRLGQGVEMQIEADDRRRGVGLHVELAGLYGEHRE